MSFSKSSAPRTKERLDLSSGALRKKGTKASYKVCALDLVHGEQETVWLFCVKALIAGCLPGHTSYRFVWAANMRSLGVKHR